jgi:hypothetical protein
MRTLIPFSPRFGVPDPLRDSQVVGFNALASAVTQSNSPDLKNALKIQQGMRFFKSHPKG